MPFVHEILQLSFQTPKKIYKDQNRGGGRKEKMLLFTFYFVMIFFLLFTKLVQIIKLNLKKRLRKNKVQP